MLERVNGVCLSPHPGNDQSDAMLSDLRRALDIGRWELIVPRRVQGTRTA